MILRTPHGNRELRLFELSSVIPHPGSSDAIVRGLGNYPPELMVPAVGCAVRLVSETIASFVMRVYTGDASQRRPLLDAPQAVLFQEPAEGWTSFDLWSDTISAGELGSAAFLWKTRTKQGVEELYPIDPDYVRVRRAKGGGKEIVARVEGRLQDITHDVVYIRGWAPQPALEGVPPIELHRPALRTASSYEEYRGRYFDQGGMPGIVLEHPGNPDRTQRRDIVQGWMRRHSGPRNAGRPGITWGGVKVQQLSPNLKDAQAAELSDALCRDVARMFRIYPSELLHAVVTGKVLGVEQWADLFMRFSLLPRMRRIERAIAADRDVFPDRSRYPRFDPSEFLRGDLATIATLVHNLVQVGVITKNEGRAYIGLPPRADGDVLLETPVGATANTKPPADDEDELDEQLAPAGADDS